jgi:hypothetical protein
LARRGRKRGIFVLETSVRKADASGCAPALKRQEGKMSESKSRTLGAVLYDKFELLDLYGPLEMFGALAPDVKIVTVAERKGEYTWHRDANSDPFAKYLDQGGKLPV